jgi:hypothetical protein
MSLNVWIAVAIAAIAVGGMFWNYLPSLATVKSWMPTLGKSAQSSDVADLAALKLLCKRYKDDPEGKAAIAILKQRFLLVPGAAE